MTIWMPDLSSHGGPKYLAIADSLSRDIQSGQLRPGTRLPPQRELADFLGVTVGTVTRGYAEAERRNLVHGQVGRGTFVNNGEIASRLQLLPDQPPDSHLLDLALNRMPRTLEPELLVAALLELNGQNSRLAALLDYQPNAGMARHREAGAEWIRRFGLDANAERVVVVAGAQHGMAAMLGAFCKPGDVILTGRLTYPGIIPVANLLHLRLEGVALDEEGIRPDALEKACRDKGGKFLYCLPTLQNPTATVMSEQRRKEIAAIARRNDLIILEDDVYGYLVPDAPAPLTVHAPERSFYLTSVSKFLGAGFRVGHLLAPEGYAQRLAGGVRATIWMASPLLVEIVSGWLADGTAKRLAAQQREEARERQKIARQILGGWTLQTNPNSCHLWLHLPEPWRADDFIAHAQERGVALTGGAAFVAGRTDAPAGVRLSLGGAETRERLTQGLNVVSELLASWPKVHLPVI